MNLSVIIKMNNCLNFVHVFFSVDFLDYPIYLMFGNYFYKNKDGNYCPAEIGLVKFTFRNGVLKKHHAFIKPGKGVHQEYVIFKWKLSKSLHFLAFFSTEKVELGYAYTAKVHSEETHRLPTPPDAYGEKNFNRVWFNMKKFMLEDGVPTFDGGNQIIFTYNDPYSNEGNQIEILKDFLNQFADDQGHKFDVYPLTRLFYVLRKKLFALEKCDDIPNENYTDVFLSRDPYDATSGISCEVSVRLWNWTKIQSILQNRHFFFKEFVAYF